MAAHSRESIQRSISVGGAGRGVRTPAPEGNADRSVAVIAFIRWYHRQRFLEMVVVGSLFF